MEDWTPERKARKRAQMRAQLASPWRGLRLFFYLCFTASAAVGTMVFLSRVLGGMARGDRELWVNSLFMTFLHIVLGVTMVVLFRAERQRETSQTERFFQKQQAKR
ncbi:DUF3493 domain-containing protein [Candidatus Cyanaurora vandensis]|uniref:DUF3493 domain-containing protein n=1 Tax=Candidatus Cyanaurora vandensis TaxID=2714958 RepID=UPI00257C5D39|nr:DUF3493 domain-containing protein [Candidatus Cyanaurora vandensis]